MPLFKDNRLRVRYTMSFGMVALVMTISGLISYQLITLQKSFTVEFTKHFTPAISAILNADRDLYQARVAELDVLIEPDTLEKSFETFEENAQQAYDRMNVYLGLLKNYPDVTNKVKGFDAAYSEWKNNSRQVFDLVRAGNLAEAKQISSGVSSTTFSSLRNFYDVAGEAADEKGLQLGESITKTVNERQLFVTSILIISILLAAIVGTIAPASMSKSLHHLRKELLRLNSGDGDLSKRIRSKRKDEIGQVANEIDSLLDGLTDLIRNVAQQSATVLTHVNDMGISTGKVNSNAKHQLESIEMIVTAVNEMAVAIKEVSENAQITATEIREVNSLTNSGKAITTESVNRIQEVSQGVSKAADVINELSKSSDKIASVLDVIRGIAEQTNLLALNAAIEAARAGEQGRGFAVVADEVRSLASKTQQSTDDIQIMIESLQKGVQDAVSAIDSGLETVKISVEKSQETLVALDSIVQAADRVANASTMIATSTEEQSHVAENVNKNLTQLADLSQEAMEEFDDNQKRADHATSVTQTLSESVTRFQLP